MSINNIFLSVDNVFTIASQLQYNGKIIIRHRYSRSDHKSTNRKKKKLNLKTKENKRKVKTIKTTTPTTHMFRDFHWQRVWY